jgi:hypothetical protein
MAESITTAILPPVKHPTACCVGSDQMLSSNVMSAIARLCLLTKIKAHLLFPLQPDKKQQELAICKCGQLAAAWLLHGGITIEKVRLMIYLMISCICSTYCRH